MAKIGFIGTGEIASAMVHGLLDQGHQILVSERGAKFANQLAQYAEVKIASNQEVINQSDIVILCLLKEVAHAVLPKLAFRATQHVISVMVDVSYDDLTALCAPTTDISITIPLPNIAVGGCPLPCYPNTDTVAQIFGAKNPVFAVSSEQGLNAHFAVTALASTSFAQTQIAVDWLAEFTGDKAAAERYLIAMLAGFFNGLPQDGRDRLATALHSLSTEGGLNATLRDYMDQSGIPATLRQGLDNFRDRLGLPRP